MIAYGAHTVSFYQCKKERDYLWPMGVSFHEKVIQKQGFSRVSAMAEKILDFKNMIIHTFLYKC